MNCISDRVLMLYYYCAANIVSKPILLIGFIFSAPESHLIAWDLKKNVGGAMHFIYYINRLTTTKVDSTCLGCLTQCICLWQGTNA